MLCIYIYMGKNKTVRLLRISSIKKRGQLITKINNSITQLIVLFVILNHNQANKIQFEIYVPNKITFLKVNQVTFDLIPDLSWIPTPFTTFIYHHLLQTLQINLRKEKLTLIGSILLFVEFCEGKILNSSKESPSLDQLPLLRRTQLVSFLEQEKMQVV